MNRSSPDTPPSGRQMVLVCAKDPRKESLRFRFNSPADGTVAASLPPGFRLIPRQLCDHSAVQSYRAMCDKNRAAATYVASCLALAGAGQPELTSVKRKFVMLLNPFPRRVRAQEENSSVALMPLKFERAGKRQNRQGARRYHPANAVGRRRRVDPVAVPGMVMVATRVTPCPVLDIVSTAALHHVFWSESGVGRCC
jgi:hypothetical protein